MNISLGGAVFTAVLFAFFFFVGFKAIERYFEKREAKITENVIAALEKKKRG